MATAPIAGVEAERPQVQIVEERCAGCEECARACPEGILALDPQRAVISVVGDGCVGCRACERTFPFGSIRVSGPLLVEERPPLALLPRSERLGSVREVRQGLTEPEMLAAASRCLDCPRPTCVEGCPAHNNIPGFIREMAAGRMQEALAVLRETSELPAVCGRVCAQALQCEGACILNQQGHEAVEIGRLERYLGDWEREHQARARVRVASCSPRSIAVVGSGPAGLSAAAELARRGHRVQILEALPFAGGILAWGVPDFSLPAEVVDEELDYLRQIGVDIHTSWRLGLDFTLDDVFAGGADAVVLAIGAEEPNSLPQPEARTLGGVITASEFLMHARRCLDGPADTRAWAWFELAVEEPLVVVGAGNTAIDVARTAVRLGLSDVLCVDLLPERLVPSSAEEKRLALDEGIRFLYGVSVRSLDADENGCVREVELAAAAPRTPRRRLARRRPAPPTLAFPARTLVQAMGYHVAPAAAEYAAGIATGAGGTLAADSSTGRTARSGVWAIGDVVNGPSTVVEAMAMGRRCARDIAAWLGGDNPVSTLSDRGDRPS